MTDYPKALAALREARTKFDAEVARVAGPQTLRHRAEELSARVLDFLDALDAARGEAVAWYRPSEEGYDSAFRDASTVARCNGHDWAGWVPLYAAPPAAVSLPAPLPPAPDTMNLTEAQREIEDAFRRGWNSCRATVMQATPAAEVPWPKADAGAAAIGWTWDYRWLESLVDAARKAGWDASMEGLDFVLSHVSAQQDPPAAAVPEGYALVPVADLESLAFTDFGRAFWTDGAEAAALRIRATLAAANKESTND